MNEGYIVAAYLFCGAGLGAIILQTIVKWRKVKSILSKINE
jgi:hypothetical protein